MRRKKAIFTAVSLSLILGMAGCTGPVSGENPTGSETKQEISSETEQESVSKTEEETSGKPKETSESQTDPGSEEETEESSSKVETGTPDENGSSRVSETPEESTEELEWGAVALSEENFPDEVFRSYLSKEFDPDQNGILEWAVLIDEIKAIDVKRMGISSLKGIEHFPNLESLDCSRNHLTELDLSKNTRLIELNCSRNELTELDLSKNNYLSQLSCYGNQLMNLDLSNIGRLYSVTAHLNPLATVKTANGRIKTDPPIEMRIDSGAQVISELGDKLVVSEFQRLDPEIDPETSATIYPDGTYVIDAMKPGYGNKEIDDYESNCRPWYDTESRKIENGFLSFDGYLTPFGGDGHVKLPISDHVMYTVNSVDDGKRVTEEEFQKAYGPCFWIVIRYGEVVEMSVSA